jgi:hypothetical protein
VGQCPLYTAVCNKVKDAAILPQATHLISDQFEQLSRLDNLIALFQNTGNSLLDSNKVHFTSPVIFQ